jgi:hypothetical protein
MTTAGQTCAAHTNTVSPGVPSRTRIRAMRSQLRADPLRISGLARTCLLRFAFANAAIAIAQDRRIPEGPDGESTEGMERGGLPELRRSRQQPSACLPQERARGPGFGPAVPAPRLPASESARTLAETGIRNTTSDGAARCGSPGRPGGGGGGPSSPGRPGSAGLRIGCGLRWLASLVSNPRPGGALDGKCRVRVGLKAQPLCEPGVLAPAEALFRVSERSRTQLEPAPLTAQPTRSRAC